jgi:transcriptional regulator with XRE-family HTH domain
MNTQETTAQKLGDLIRSARKSRKMQQQDLAKQTGLTQNFLSQVENGRRNLSFPALEKILKVLDFKMNIILSDGVTIVRKMITE